MDRTQIQQYFRGEASEQQILHLLDWVEASEEHRHIFERERMLYDVSLFSEQTVQRHSWRSSWKSISRWVGGVAAAVAVVAGCTWWVLQRVSSTDAVTAQTVIAPAGQQAQVVLPDGSKVWLNSQSILTYKSNFGAKTRDVSLDGEAYFEVAKDAHVPFNVVTESNRVQVVGTHFNVCAYHGSRRFQATLLEGCVEVFSEGQTEAVARLAPHEYYREENGVGKKGVVKAGTEDIWQDGILRFDDLPFMEVATRLEQYYGVKLVVRNEALRKYRCTGKFKVADGIDHILGVIQKDQPFDYHYSNDHKEVIIE